LNFKEGEHSALVGGEKGNWEGIFEKGEGVPRPEEMDDFYRS